MVKFLLIAQPFENEPIISYKKLKNFEFKYKLIKKNVDRHKEKMHVDFQINLYKIENGKPIKIKRNSKEILEEIINENLEDFLKNLNEMK